MTTRICSSIFFIGLLLLNTNILAQNSIEVSDTITENTTWSADTVKVIGDVTVADSITLIIEPGVMPLMKHLRLFTIILRQAA